jgi:hypothetical protein
MTVTQVAYPTAPPTEPRRGTLLDVATVSDSGIRWLDGNDLFDSYNCMKFQAEADFCAPNVKDFDQAAVWQNGWRFAVYGGVQCKAVGLDMDRMQDEVRRVFEAGESVGVEKALMRTRFRQGEDRDPDAVGTDFAWDAPVDITPAGGAVSAQAGLAIIEGHAAANYVGMPIIHAPVTVASALTLNAVIEFDGNVLKTALGSRVAAGAGYDWPNLGPDGAEAPAGEKWLYATGGVLINKGSLEIRQAIAFEDNDVFVLAERGYIAAVDCYVAAVRVKV